MKRVDSVLNYEFKIDLNSKVNRNKAFVFLAVCAIALAVLVYCLGERWFWAENKNYYENRIDNIKEIIKEQPQPNSLKAELAINHYLSGEIDKAKVTLSEILRQEPGNEAATLYLGLILSDQKEYKESIKWLTKYVEKNQGLETRIAYLYLGRSHLAVNEYEKAAGYLEEASRRDPGNPVVYFYLGQSYEKLNKIKAAISAYEKAISITGNYTEAELALKSLVKKQK